jgi:glycolate oxidase FAD binding subunit
MPLTLEALRKAGAAARPGAEPDAVQGIVPSWVAEPATVAEAAEVMRAAAEHGLAVVPRGAGTRLSWGLPPSRCDLLVDTRRLDRVIEHAAGDLVAKVEAGLTMDRLAEVLAARRQRLALDTPLAGSTVGGTLATAAAGPLRLRYGTARDLIIGVTLVRADGSVAKAGGKVVKNVAGYDLGKLFTGSYGTLGLIVEAVFRLHPLPAAQAYITCEAADAAHAHRAVQAVLHSSVVPSAVEMDGVAPGPITLAVLVEGVAESIAARAATVAELLGEAAQAAAHTQAAAPGWWGRYPEADTLLEVTAPPALVSVIMQSIDEQLHDHGMRGVGVRGSAGSGRWHVGVPGEYSARAVGALVEALRSALAGHAGAVIVRVAPDEVREHVDMWGPVASLTLQRRVKDQFDPEHRLAPGRFAGGI